MTAATRSQFEASLVPRNVAALRLELWLGTFLVPVFWPLDWATPALPFERLLKF